MSISTEELAYDLINHLNHIGQYSEFVNWMVERGWGAEEVEEQMEAISEGI